MAYYLAKERDKDVVAAYKAYQEYLSDKKSIFPSGAFMLGTAVWYQDANDHRCPHDGHLHTMLIAEEVESVEPLRRFITIRIKLKNRYGDGCVELYYPKVFRYEFFKSFPSNGMGDWRYDEFTVSSKGTVIHEIEWSGPPLNNESRWIIESSDVLYSWIPEDPASPGNGTILLPR